MQKQQLLRCICKLRFVCTFGLQLVRQYSTSGCSNGCSSTSGRSTCLYEHQASCHSSKQHPNSLISNSGQLVARHGLIKIGSSRIVAGRFFFGIAWIIHCVRNDANPPVSPHWDWQVSGCHPIFRNLSDDRSDSTHGSIRRRKRISSRGSRGRRVIYDAMTEANVNFNLPHGV